MRSFGNQLVRLVNAERVVDAEKIVEVDVQDGGLLAVLARAVERAGQGVQEGAAVGQAGQLVEGQQGLDVLLMFLAL